MRTFLASMLAAACCALLPGAAVAGQSPTARPAANVPVQPAAAPQTPAPEPAAPYNYNADGRRDPFLSLIGGGGDAKPAPRQATAGLGGIRVDELSVRGIMQSRERLVAMVQGPDNRTYLIHQGDKLADGMVKSVTPQGLVLVQDVNDPRAREKSREVRKPLRSPEDEKE
ncbi:MAG: pilus assembly protein PilP [Acidobacteria bacterium]|nr:pilus assembly protein PilP [Acidobacteriota bacterium]